MSKSEQVKVEETGPKPEAEPTETEEETTLEEGEAAAEPEELSEVTKEETAEKEKETPEETALKEEAAQEGVEEKKEEKKPEKEELEEDIVEERFYTIPLRRAWIMPPRKRAPRAIRIIKGFIQKHMKIGITKETEEETEEEEKEERLIISAELNEKIWLRGIEKPPRRIKVRVVKDSEGNVTVYPAKGD